MDKLTDIRLLFSFEGRINRVRYWYALFASGIFCLVLLLQVAFVIGGILGADVDPSTVAGPTGASTASRSIQHGVPAFLVHNAACRSGRMGGVLTRTESRWRPISGPRDLRRRSLRWIGPGTCSASRAASTAPNLARGAGHHLLDDLPGRADRHRRQLLRRRQIVQLRGQRHLRILDPATYRSLSRPISFR